MPQFGPWLPTSPFEVFHKVALPTSPNWSCQCRGRWGQWRYHLRHLNQNEIMGYALAPVQCVWQVGQCKADHSLAAKFHGLSCINGFGSCRALVGPTRYKVPPSGIGIGNWHEKAHSSNKLKTAKRKAFNRETPALRSPSALQSSGHWSIAGRPVALRWRCLEFSGGRGCRLTSMACSADNWCLRFSATHQRNHHTSEWNRH